MHTKRPRRLRQRRGHSGLSEDKKESGNGVAAERNLIWRDIMGFRRFRQGFFREALLAVPKPVDSARMLVAGCRAALGANRVPDVRHFLFTGHALSAARSRQARPVAVRVDVSLADVGYPLGRLRQLGGHLAQPVNDMVFRASAFFLPLTTFWAADIKLIGRWPIQQSARLDERHNVF